MTILCVVMIKMMMMMWWWHTDNYHNAVGTGAGEDGDDADDCGEDGSNTGGATMIWMRWSVSAKMLMSAMLLPWEAGTCWNKHCCC